MSRDLVVQIQDLLENPTHRVPIALCLDVSGSMAGEPIEELNRGVRLFLDSLREDPIARFSAEVAIVTFSDSAVLQLDFQSLDRIIEPPILSASGQTDLGGGVLLALMLLQNRKHQYQQAGVDYFQPWLVLMTDGQPTTEEHPKAAEEVRKLEREGRLVVFPIGIGPNADMAVLAMFSEKRRPLRLRGLNFREFFAWLSKSVVRVSQSRPGEKITLDLDGIKGWAEL
ncbi:vWA domain-containing protein [Thermogutta sp.]|uniref:vWA domain-containing protein n=1 Tax=Thermogutta sp. TaxID=1962930 RepID=UPI00321FC83C